MEHLNKTQIVLLAVLVSFVSSIATGIVTVTLMQQAPGGVTQTINRVVERTIEKVIPIKGPTVTETKVVKEEDLIVAAIEKNSKAIVKITTGADSSLNIPGIESGNGVILSEDGFVVTDGTVSGTEDLYYAETSDGQIFQLARVADKRSFSLFKITPKEKTAVKLTPVSFSDSDTAKVGQSVISLGNEAATGIISGLSYEKEDTTATTTPAANNAKKSVSLIYTSTNPRDSLGSAIIDLKGNMMGISAIRAGERATIPANVIHEALSEAQKKK